MDCRDISNHASLNGIKRPGWCQAFFCFPGWVNANAAYDSPENRTIRQSTRNGEKTNGKTKNVGTVKPPEKINELVYAAAALKRFSIVNRSALIETKIEPAARPGNIAICRQKRQP